MSSVRRPSCQARATRICREAGGTVALNVVLRDLNVDVARQNERRIEVIVNGLQSTLHWCPPQHLLEPTRTAAVRVAGAAFAFARIAKERTYPHLRQSEHMTASIHAKFEEKASGS